ncbi:MAG: DUF2442 domain-containing protein [Bacteroides sp.]|nr:DUF2442 domain-containing protein [Bacteroides sp.]
MKIKEIWFEGDYLYGKSDDGRIYRQSLLWYPHLRTATEQERNEYTLSTIGIHWRKLDEDVSFESFEYEDAEPSKLQRFFLTHKEINVSEFAKQIGLNPTLLRNYINGFKKPSKERENEILGHIHKIGTEYSTAIF